MSPVAEIIARFDALNTGGVRLFICSDGDVGASCKDSEIRQSSTLASLTGYGSTADVAIENLWGQVKAMKVSDLVVTRPGKPDRRYYRWNGGAWKEEEAPV